MTRRLFRCRSSCMPSWGATTGGLSALLFAGSPRHARLTSSCFAIGRTLLFARCMLCLLSARSSGRSGSFPRLRVVSSCASSWMWSGTACQRRSDGSPSALQIAWRRTPRLLFGCPQFQFGRTSAWKPEHSQDRSSPKSLLRGLAALPCSPEGTHEKKSTEFPPCDASRHGFPAQEAGDWALLSCSLVQHLLHLKSQSRMQSVLEPLLLDCY
mmetsp:Transcript_33064/g.68240  ORF Transcript_33064/g.68240 Transcript_33064/m.68240 type:complete len:212 (+) Transcript_33064:666-1301(+)